MEAHPGNKWKKVKLIEVAQSIKAGGTPKRMVDEYWNNGNIPWLKISDLKSIHINSSEEKITEEGLNNSSAKLFPEGTILYSIFATLGAIGILNFESATNQAIAGITPNNEIVDTKYLYYCLISEKKNIVAKKSRATQDNINLKILKNHEIPLPPLKTQQKIVEILEKAEKLKEWRAEADVLADEYLKSVFLEMFGDPYKNEKGWNERLLKDLIEIPLNSGWSPNCSDEKGGLPVFSLANLDGNSLNININKYYYGENPKKGFDLKKGDLLISRSNTMELVGRVGLYRGKPEKVLYPDLMIRIRLNKELNPVFFEKYLQSDPAMKLIRRFAHGTSGSMVKISQKNLEKLKVIVPPLELQNQFAETVQKVEHLKHHQNQSKQEIDNLFNTLMQKAFKGELTC